MLIDSSWRINGIDRNKFDRVWSEELRDCIASVYILIFVSEYKSRKVFLILHFWTVTLRQQFGFEDSNFLE